MGLKLILDYIKSWTFISQIILVSGMLMSHAQPGFLCLYDYNQNKTHSRHISVHKKVLNDRLYVVYDMTQIQKICEVK